MARVKRLAEYVLIAMVYPVFAFLTAEEKLLKGIDALTITGLILIIIGVFFSLIRHGDFDIIEYVARRSVRGNQMKPFRAFRDDQEEKRKGGMNYPLWTGILLLAAAGILTTFCFYR